MKSEKGQQQSGPGQDQRDQKGDAPPKPGRQDGKKGDAEEGADLLQKTAFGFQTGFLAFSYGLRQEILQLLLLRAAQGSS